MRGDSRLVAGVFFAGDLLFWHHAIEYVGAGLATVLGNLQVLIVGVVAWLVFGERPTRTTLLALPVVLAGVVLISGVIGGGAYGADPALGVVLGVLTAICYSAYLLLIRIGGRDARRPAGPVALATVSIALTASIVGVVGGDLDLTPGPESLFWLALLGITSQSIGYLCISISLPRLPAVVTSIILLVQPVVTVAPEHDPARRAPITGAAVRRRLRHRRDRGRDGARGPGPRRAARPARGADERRVGATAVRAAGRPSPRAARPSRPRPGPAGPGG